MSCALCMVVAILDFNDATTRGTLKPEIIAARPLIDPDNMLPVATDTVRLSGRSPGYGLRLLTRLGEGSQIIWHFVTTPRDGHRVAFEKSCLQSWTTWCNLDYALNNRTVHAVEWSLIVESETENAKYFLNNFSNLMTVCQHLFSQNVYQLAYNNGWLR